MLTQLLPAQALAPRRQHIYGFTVELTCSLLQTAAGLIVTLTVTDGVGEVIEHGAGCATRKMVRGAKGCYRTLKYATFEYPMTARALSRLACTPPARITRTVPLHRALETVFFHCTHRSRSGVESKP